MLRGRTASLPVNLNIRNAAGDALAHLGVGKPAEACLHVVPWVLNLTGRRNRAGDRGMRNDEL